MMLYVAVARYLPAMRGRALTRTDLSVLAFGGWSLASVILFFQPNNPSELGSYWFGLHGYLFPIFGYFAIKTISPDEQWKVLKFAMWMNMFCIVLGLYLWYARPDFYTEYLREMIFNESEDARDWQLYSRLQSYLGSTALGVLCALTIVMAGTVRIGLAPMISIVAICGAAAVLTSQRGGMAASAVGMFYVLISPRKNRALNAGILLGGLFAAAVILIQVTGSFEGGLDYYLSRREDFHDMLEGRRGYSVGIDYITAFPLGVGLGGSGNAAYAAGLMQWDKVVDANFMRIWADLGIQGLIMFALAIGFAMRAGLKRHFGLTVMIGVYLLVAVGTNVFDGHLTPQLFWMVLGMADTPEEEPAFATEPIESEPDPDVLPELQPAARRTSEHA
jgi:hypothetical protein